MGQWRSAQSEVLLYKIEKNNKSFESVQYYLPTILLWPVYYGNQRFHLKNNKNKGAFVLFTCIILSGCQLVRCSFKIKLIGMQSEVENKQLSL